MERDYLLLFLLMLEVYWQLEVVDGFSFGFWKIKLKFVIWVINVSMVEWVFAIADQIWL